MNEILKWAVIMPIGVVTILWNFLKWSATF